ncbi:MAG: hypothetical protein M1838_001756 [Thelocarpon superellum]|nr:MAG: hypothetical protein M1838_001756 [Thelocarpon superellum]
MSSSMTATAMSSTETTAPWKPLFLSHVAKLASPEFVMSSLHASPDAAAPVPYVPRVRYLIYRGMWAELPENKHNQAPLNERVYESDLPTFATDVRMEKIPEIFASSAGHGSPAQSQGSGGGGPVEAVWWVKEVMTQWRMRGEAFVVAPDIEGAGEESSGVRTTKSEIGKRMKPTREGGESEWSWARELTAHFGNLNPGMRGSFRNPPPGTPIGVPPPQPELSLGQKVMDLDDAVAREHFRVVIIRPDVVDQIDLSEPDRARRWRFTYVGPPGAARAGEAVGEWSKEELWP